MPNSIGKNQANYGSSFYQKRLFYSNCIVTESSLISVGFLGFRHDSICGIVSKVTLGDNMDRRVGKLQSYTDHSMTH